MSKVFLITIRLKRWNTEGVTDEKGWKDKSFETMLKGWIKKQEFYVWSIENNNHIHIGVAGKNYSRTDSLRRPLKNIVPFQVDDLDKVALNIKEFDTLENVVYYVCKDGSYESSDLTLVKEIIKSKPAHPPIDGKEKSWSTETIVQNYKKYLRKNDMGHHWKTFKMWCSDNEEKISYHSFSKIRKEVLIDYLDACKIKVFYNQPGECEYNNGYDRERYLEMRLLESKREKNRY